MSFTYDIESLDSSIASAELWGERQSILAVIPHQPGITGIRVRADDSCGRSAEHVFAVEVRQENRATYAVTMPEGFPALALGESFTVRVEAEGVTVPVEIVLQASWSGARSSDFREVRASLTASNPRTDVTLALPDEAWSALANANSNNRGYLRVSLHASGDSTLVPAVDAVPDFTRYLPPLSTGDQWAFRVEGDEMGARIHQPILHRTQAAPERDVDVGGCRR